MTGGEAAGLPPGVRGTVATVGTFDGVHRGHRDILSRLSERARHAGLASLLVTFDPHPLEIVNPAAAPLLLTVGDERLEALAPSGVDYVAIVPFTPALRRYTAERFVREILRRRFRMQELVIGYDHGLGRGREGNADVLRELGAQRGFPVEIVDAVLDEDGQPVSSTGIRQAVAEGNLAGAARGLGRLYSVNGTVVQGDRRGRLLGFPTINIGGPPPRKLLPPEGVYAVQVHTPSGAFGGMMNLGPRPTFGDAAISLEAHLFDAAVELYGAPVRVDFVARLRETKRFSGAEALVAQLRDDALQARNALTLMEKSGNVYDSSRPFIP
jgi:riboflavin kinase/FMN adenylyltransferase